MRRCSFEPGRSGGENAAHQLVGPLRRRHVEDARDGPRFDERLHRAPAGAGRVEHEDLVSLGLQALPRALDAARRIAEHACDDERLRRALGDRGRLHHRADRPCGAPEDRSREAVEPATSTMLGTITMSFSRTYGATLPLATVETMTFGSPSGSARMAAVPIAVPPDPPSDSTPCIRPSAASRESVTAAAPAMASTIAPRSPEPEAPRDRRRLRRQWRRRRCRCCIAGVPDHPRPSSERCARAPECTAPRRRVPAPSYRTFRAPRWCS